MALKAGTVGVNWKEVDNEGNIIDGGGTGGGVTDVKVDGVSVVSGGVASITLPEVPVQDVEVGGTSVVNAQGVAEITLPEVGDVILKEVSNASQADICVVRITSVGWTLNGDEYQKTAITVDGTTYNVLAYKDSRSDGLYLDGKTLVLNRCTESGTSSQFICVIETGAELRMRFNANSELEDITISRVGKAKIITTSLFIQQYTTTSGNGFTFKFYKLQEV